MSQETELLGKIKEQTQGQLDEIKKDIDKKAKDFKAGLITEDAYNEGMQEINEKLKDIDTEKFKAFEQKLADMKEVMKTQGDQLAKYKETGGVPTDVKTFGSQLKDVIDSEKFKEFVDNRFKGKAEFALEGKLTNITDDYTGTSRVHITSRDPRLVDHPRVERLNIRDLLRVMPHDLPSLAFLEVYDWDRESGVVSENGVLPESSFKVREATTNVKRLGTHLPVSKRMFTSLPVLMDHLMTRLPAQVKYHEDYQLLWGDNTGENLQGMFDRVRDFTTVVNTTVTGAAGSVASIESVDAGARVRINFAANQDNIQNGDTITIAGATSAPYNAEHTSLILLDPRTIEIELTYVAEADTSAWTFTVENALKDSIANAQEIDVLKAAKTIVSQQEYMADGIILNPTDVLILETLKGSDEHYLDLQRLENGTMMISGLPVVETTAMPSGRFMVADFQMIAALLMFKDLTLEFSESTQEKLNNTVEVIIYEEVLFPIYNHFLGITGRFSTAKTAINA